MWILPSRSRPENVARFFDAYRVTKATTPGVVFLDKDDPELLSYQGVELPEGWRIEIQTRKSLIEIYNDAARIPADWYGFIADDVVPITEGWDKALIEAAGRDKVAYCADGINDERLCCHGVIGADVVQRWGFVMLPGLKRLYADNVLTVMATRDKCLVYLPHVRVEHRHFSTGAAYDKTYEKPEAAEDRALYELWVKEQPAIHIACVQVGNYLGRGAEYVNKLHDMVCRNMPAHTIFNFVCFTDDASGLHKNIDARPAEKLDGWWAKLGMFKRGVFPEGEQVFFFDLDTLIVAPLDDLVGYRGDFCALRDFYRKDGLGSGFMSWKPEKAYDIWETWNGEHLSGGDQEQVERCKPDADRWQDLYPAQVVSYKVHCNPYPPHDSRVVCFHGNPRPHETAQKWVADTWEIGGSGALWLTVESNTCNAKALENVKANADRAKWVGTSPAHDEIAIICGSGPSLLDTLNMVSGGVIFALNNAGKILTEHGITPEYQVVLDARPENAKFLGYAKTTLLASQVDPSLFDCDGPVYLWHPVLDGIEELFPERNMTLIGGGTTVGLSSIALAYAMGFRRFKLFGYDSSFREGQTHAAPQARTEQENWTFDVTVGNRTFRSNAAMAKQAELFPQFASQLAELDCEIAVYGDGLLPYIARIMATQS